MASSQNEQDNRRYAVAAGVPMFEPSDSQEAYDMTRLALRQSEAWKLPVMLRLTTRICHSKSVVRPGEPEAPPEASFVRDVQGRVMIPAHARPAHHRLRNKLEQAAKWNEEHGPVSEIGDNADFGIITSGVAYMHAAEAAPEASVLKLGMTYPLPLERIRRFASAHKTCQVIEEGDPYLVEQLRTAGIAVDDKPAMFRFGELNVDRVRRIIEKDESPEAVAPRGKPPQLCNGCPHRVVFSLLRDAGAIVAGDIGCYTLGVLPPFSAMDTCVCMGAAIGVGLGLRHVLPKDEARRVVSVIGDSTFVHSGITGLAEMVYNPPASGHVVLILDNGTTAMTGLQEHPGTGRTLDHQPTGKIVPEEIARAMGITNVAVVDPSANPDRLTELVEDALGRPELSVIVTRRNCLLAAGKIKSYERAINADGELELCHAESD
jgi:indolepyruvate ferredoxin oxidoreductase alpha subunit